MANDAGEQNVSLEKVVGKKKTVTISCDAVELWMFMCCSHSSSAFAVCDSKVLFNNFH